MKKIGVVSLGCAKNRINTEQMMYLLSQAGYLVSGDVENADAVLINTCAFIESAKSEAIETILEFAELKKAGKIGNIIVAGCLPERYKDELLNELPEVDAIVGTGSFDDIVEVTKVLQRNGHCSDTLASEPNPTPRCLNNNHSASTSLSFFKDINSPVSETKRIITTSPEWTYLKIAEGCDNRCAYCCIPYIRGKYRSRSMESIVAEARELADRGIKEINLVAQDVTSYGVDLYGKPALAELLQELSKIPELVWIRLLYLYPDKINDELIDEIEKNDKIVKYLDIPIQHINNKILKSMNRSYTGEQVKTLINKLRERIKDVVIRTSIITGLPGEEKEEFNELLDFLREAKIERAGVFTYSPEEGTTAAAMQRPDNKTAQRRAKTIEKLQSQIMHKFEKSKTASKFPILIDGRSYAEAPEIDGIAP